MKNEEIRKCDHCKGPLRRPGEMMCGATITVQRHVLNLANARAMAGLTMMLNGAERLAQVLAPGYVLDSPRELFEEHLLCEACFMPIMAALEKRRTKEVASDVEPLSNSPG